MSQPTSGQDWPAWLNLLWGMLAVPAAYAWRWASSRLSRTELTDYLQERDRKQDEYLATRDQLSEDRHRENLGNFKELFKATSTTGERVARLEGVITGNHRQL